MDINIWTIAFWNDHERNAMNDDRNDELRRKIEAETEDLRNRAVASCYDLWVHKTGGFKYMTPEEMLNKKYTKEELLADKEYGNLLKPRKTNCRT